MSLGSELVRWDGACKDSILVVWGEHNAQPDFVEALLSLISEPECARGATWLLKRWLETRTPLSMDQAAAVYAALPHLTDWQTRLHILQSMPYLPIPKACWHSVEKFLRISLSDSNKFVRAWTYSGLNDLANANHALRNEVDTLLDMGLRDEPASVRARIRNIRRIEKGTAQARQLNK